VNIKQYLEFLCVPYLLLFDLKHSLQHYDQLQRPVINTDTFTNVVSPRDFGVDHQERDASSTSMMPERIEIFACLCPSRSRPHPSLEVAQYSSSSSLPHAGRSGGGQAFCTAFNPPPPPHLNPTSPPTRFNTSIIFSLNWGVWTDFLNDGYEKSIFNMWFFQSGDYLQGVFLPFFRFI
jgi:hypothetical protein